MTTSSETYTLPADPRANACGAFFDALKSRRGTPLQIDAANMDGFGVINAIREGGVNNRVPILVLTTERVMC